MSKEEMSKQEWVKRYLEDILSNAWRLGRDGKGIDLTKEANKALLHLTKWGVVVKVRGDLPKYQVSQIKDDFGGAKLVGFNTAITRMLKSGYTQTEPLIGEE